MRIELAKILLKKPKLLLLDEPTNHLDIEAIYWLENFLKSYYGAIVVISHDRAFLDGVTERTIEISLGKIYDYKANFSNYEILRKERRQQQLNAYENQKKQIEKTEDFINRFRYQATKAVQVQSKIKQLAKVERIEVDDDDNAKIHFKFPPSPRSGTVVTETKDLCKSFKEKEVLKNINFIIERGEKVAFVGKNGEGKSTLSKIIIGELDYYGNLKLGHNLKIGYFAQNQELLLDTEKTVFETLDDIAEGEVRKNVRNLLGSFLFSGEDIDKKVKVLSGGEKTRLALSKLLLEPYNLLVLDEPTNHLDIKSKEVLKYALKNYDGTLIVVSHDRDFLNGLVDKIYEFKDKNIKQFIGNIYDFLEMKNLESLDMLNKNSVSKISEKKEISTNKLDYEERKQLARDVRKLENQILNIEKEIEEIEKEILNLNNLLGNPAKITAENIDYSELYKTIEKLNKKLEEKTYEWEVVSIQKDEIEIGLQ
jgi:ATP-binding cassette subfamily F protein 3